MFRILGPSEIEQFAREGLSCDLAEVSLSLGGCVNSFYGDGNRSRSAVALCFVSAIV